jgi:hypothetical protein
MQPDFSAAPLELISQTRTEPEWGVRFAGKVRNRRHSRSYGEVSQRSQRAEDPALATGGFAR